MRLTTLSALSTTILLSLSFIASANDLNDYAIALKMSDTRVACETFQNLAEKNRFILAPMARLRSYEKCESLDPAPLWQLVDSRATAWTSPLREQIALQIAVETKNHRRIVDLTPAVLKITSAQPKKEALLDRAIASARALNDQRSVESLQKRLYKVAPRRDPSPSFSNLLKVAKDHRENLNWQSAVATYQQVFDQTDSRLTRLDALNGIRFSYKMKYRFHGGALEDFLRNARIMRDFCEESLNQPSRHLEENYKLVDAWAQYARDEWSYGSADKAREITHALMAHPNVKGFLLARAQYLMSRIHANYNEWNASKTMADLAIESMRGHRQKTKWQKELWDNAHWNAAWASRKLNQLQDSVATLKSILATTQVHSEKKKHAFWLGKTWNDLGHPNKAKPYLKKAIQLAPYHFYGLVAHEQLGQKLSALKNETLKNPVRPSKVSRTDFQRILALKNVKEDTQSQRLTARRLANRADLNELRLRAFTGDYAKIWRIFFSKLSGRQRNKFVTEHASLIYPRPFYDLVEPWAGRYQRISEEYVYSIMRQESAFSPTTHSWANAYGLLQLLPEVAREVQNKAGVHFTHDYELFIPEINVPLGITHMDDLFIHNKSNFILSTASYNGTKEAARRWYDRLFRGDAYEFIEDIPFSETRNYVKLVMRNFVMNFRLKNKNAVDFPPHLIELSDNIFAGSMLFTSDEDDKFLRPRYLL